MSQTEISPVHITMILDRSGSMAPIADDIVGGFNTFLAEQHKVAGDARVTLIQFDTQDPYETLIDGMPLAEVTDLDPAQYQPRGGTPLYDTVGRAMRAIDLGIAGRADRRQPREDQVVVVITDGEENSSIAFRQSQVFAMIEERKERGWTFVFLGANQDAYAEGGGIGVDRGNIKQFLASKAGVDEMFGDLSVETSRFRAMKQADRVAKAKRFMEDSEDKA